MKRQQQTLKPAPLVMEDRARADFINRFMGAQGQQRNNPDNVYAANPVPSKFAVPGDFISQNLIPRRNPYGDVTTSEDGNSLFNVVEPTWAASRIMAPNPAKGFDQQPNIGFPEPNTKNIDAAMLQNVPPPQNTQTVAISPEARGTNTSFSGFGSSGRNQPPPQAS